MWTCHQDTVSLMEVGVQGVQLGCCKPRSAVAAGQETPCPAGGLKALPPDPHQLSEAAAVLYMVRCLGLLCCRCGEDSDGQNVQRWTSLCTR